MVNLRVDKPRLLALIGTVTTLAVAALVAQARWPRPDDWPGLLLLGTFALFSGGFQIKVPGMRGAIAISDCFLLIALGAYGGFEAALVAALGVLGTVVGPDATRRAPKVAYNLSNVILATSLAGVVFELFGGQPGGALPTMILPLLLATTTHLLCNVTLVAIVVVIDNPARRFPPIWRNTFSWAALSSYVAFPLAVALLVALRNYNDAALALAIPPTWMLFSFYRTNKIRQELQLNRIEQIEELNDQLEEKVTERTQELQKAFQDIAEANRRLRGANDRLTEANQAKSEFLANVSHELRTPLNAVIGFSELLRDGSCGGLNGKQQEYVRDIHDSGDHLLGLINDILDLSKIEAGKMEVHLECIPIARAIDEAVAMLRPQATKKGVDLETEVSDDVELAQLDPGMMRQVLVNLLSNAVKFTPDGGRVVVRAVADGNDLVLSVEDSGVGIPQRHLGRIFEEFYQVDGSYSRSYQGTGLGLALVRRMVHKQDGEIDVQSTVGEGTAFRMRFRDGRVQRASSPEAVSEATESTSPSTAPGSRRVRVLIVEDNALNMKLARSALQRVGWSVEEATRGEVALEFLRHERVDLILMDIQLPGMDGLTVTRRIKEQPELADIPVVALSAHAKESDGQRAREAGCAGYITKPIRLSQFPADVASYLDGPLPDVGDAETPAERSPDARSA